MKTETKLPPLKKAITRLAPQVDGVLFWQRHGQGVRESVYLASMTFNRN